MMQLNEAIVIICLFHAMKYAISRPKESMHDSMQPSGKPLNDNVVGPTIINANKFHLEASSVQY